MPLAWLFATAFAADWPLLQGSEAGRPDVPVSVGGFVQVDLEAGLRNGALADLPDPLADHDGQLPLFNTSPSPQLYVRRVRPMLRGSIPGSDQRVSWLVMAELGQSSTTRTSPVVLTDASITLTATPWFQVRLGRFKLPVMEEALESNPIAAQLIAFSEPARALVMENPVRDGAYTGGANGFRDVGIEVFGTQRWGSAAVSGQLMVSNGGREVDGWYDVTGRVQVAWLFSSATTDPHRDEIGLTAWHQQGHRTLDGAPALRVREGLGVQVDRGPVHARAEVVHAVGAIERAPELPGQPVVVEADGHAAGGVVEASVRWWRLVGAARWAGLWTDPGAVDARVQHTATFGLRWHPFAKAHLEVDYERRWQAAPNDGAAAQQVVAAQGDRVLGSVTVVF